MFRRGLLLYFSNIITAAILLRKAVPLLDYRSPVAAERVGVVASCGHVLPRRLVKTNDSELRALLILRPTHTDAKHGGVIYKTLQKFAQ